MQNSLYPLQWAHIIKNALKEDLGDAGDITTQSIIPESLNATGQLIAKKPGRICGLEMAAAAFLELDPHAKIQYLVNDGADVKPETVLMNVSGNARALLSAERTALNILARLSGIATLTQAFVQAVKPHSTEIVCTRKTTPGLRVLEKYAVRIGGGKNHRFGLYDGILIKDNHWALTTNTLAETIHQVRKAVGHMVKIEVEVETVESAKQALSAGVDLLLCDNMTSDNTVRAQLSEVVSLAKGKALCEASGGINLNNVHDAAATGVDLISIGALTHSANALDISLDLHLKR